MILAVTNDLITATPIERASQQNGERCLVVAPENLSDVEDLPIRLVILDLLTIDDVTSFVESVHNAFGSDTPVIAFGPHVDAELLSKAQAAGCTQVLSRGQFHRDLRVLIADAVAAHR
ncbi:hypothetical protein [Aeoliella mucimassa]|uniref:Response regulatory domain-containing protein n=1 Tax=Aeoliella mucimassa TaxID=2527972 RepID=A0A518ATJ5_9BACT|nr:hypothetical protein [Aeoliella mucimassa]QDU58051.1 hypothetical protein Pan181_42770 [Aeoliella mucimassa]